MYRTFFHLTYKLAVIYVYKKKTPREVSYGTLILPFFICNIRTTSTTQLKLSEMKRSSIKKLAAKICVPEVAAIKTVTHSGFFFNGRYIRGKVIVLKFWECVLLNEKYNSCSEHNFLGVIDFLL